MRPNGSKTTITPRCRWSTCRTWITCCSVLAQAIPAWLICDRRFLHAYGLGLIHPGTRRLKRFIDAGYLVVADNAVTVPPSAQVIRFPGASDQIQNGSPDGEALINTSSQTLVDALSYEGSITMAQIQGFMARFAAGFLRVATFLDTLVFTMQVVYRSIQVLLVNVARNGRGHQVVAADLRRDCRHSSSSTRKSSPGRATTRPPARTS